MGSAGFGMAKDQQVGGAKKKRKVSQNDRMNSDNQSEDSLQSQSDASRR